MTHPWRDSLKKQGAVYDAHGIVIHFGQRPVSPDHPALCLCDHLGIIEVSGADAATFLHSQLSADLRTLQQNDLTYSRLAMHLNLKGRAETSLRVVPHGEAFWLITHKSLIDSTLAGLKKYVLFSKVTLTPLPEQVVLGLTGTDAAQQLEQAGLPVPSETDQVCQGTAWQVVRPGLRTRFMLIGSVQEAATLWASLSSHTPVGGSDHWQLSDISAGEGHIVNDTRDLFLPQALNYDVLGGVSFKKGCYLGQEVVARMHFKGKMKQRMQHVSWPGDVVPPPGALLRNEGDKAAGEVICAVSTATDTHALVNLRRDHEGELFYEHQALAFDRYALPYSLPES